MIPSEENIIKRFLVVDDSRSSNPKNIGAVSMKA